MLLRLENVLSTLKSASDVVLSTVRWDLVLAYLKDTVQDSIIFLAWSQKNGSFTSSLTPIVKCRSFVQT